MATVDHPAGTVSNASTANNAGTVGNAGTASNGADAEPIGSRLKAVRLARRKTLADVAAQSGLTKGFLSKLERDQTTPSVASLMRLCQTLDISVGTLFHAPNGEVVRHDAYQPINFGGTRMKEYLLTPHGERRVQAILSDIAPGGGSGDEPYVLPSDVEFVFVLEGRLQVTVNDEQVFLEAGDAFTFPPQSPHCFRSVTTTGQTRVLWIFFPALPVDGPAQGKPAQGKPARS